MACGAGFYQLAIISTLIAILVLIGLGKMAKQLEHFRTKQKPESTPDELDLVFRIFWGDFMQTLLSG
jgi:uncharacterized membrane protein YhiD involved in acid resistance